MRAPGPPRRGPEGPEIAGSRRTNDLQRRREGFPQRKKGLFGGLEKDYKIFLGGRLTMFLGYFCCFFVFFWGGMSGIICMFGVP